VVMKPFCVLFYIILIRIFNNDITTNFVLAKGKSSKRKYRFLPVGSLCCFCKSYYSLPKGIRIFFSIIALSNTGVRNGGRIGT